MALLKIGQMAPSFSSTAVGGGYGSGSPVKLSDFRGNCVVLYFYPKDYTPGCTTQACGIRDSWHEIRKSGVALFGVSTDPEKSHEKFISKFNLPFPLLADANRAIVESYGVWVEKSMYGRKYMGTEHTTFIIDSKGRITAILSKVKPSEHAAMVLDSLKRIEN